MPHGFDNLDALRSLMIVAQRGQEVALSENVLHEVAARSDPHYLNWAFELADYWQGCLDAYGEESPFHGPGEVRAQRLSSPDFGYLSKKDRAVLEDAIALECDHFLTLDSRLVRNARHLHSRLGIHITTPRDLWVCFASAGCRPNWLNR